MVLSKTSHFVLFQPPEIQMNCKWCCYNLLVLFFTAELRCHHIWKKTSIGLTLNSMCCFFFLAVILFLVTNIFLCLLLAVSDYRQSLQFQNLNQEKQNIQLEVCINMIWKYMISHFLIFQCFVFNERETSEPMQVMRGGRTVKISIFDIVVGDVVPLKIGDQVRFISEKNNFLLCI